MEKILEKACSTPGCGKGSTLQCPTCVKLGLPPAYFCSQECFKNFWVIHKFSHQKEDPKKDEKKDKYKYSVLTIQTTKIINNFSHRVH